MRAAGTGIEPAPMRFGQSRRASFPPRSELLPPVPAGSVSVGTVKAGRP